MKDIQFNEKNLTRKEDLNRIRGLQQFEDHNQGPAKNDSNRNDINDPISE